MNLSIQPAFRKTLWAKAMESSIAKDLIDVSGSGSYCTDERRSQRPPKLDFETSKKAACF